ncbi:ABC transporter permease/M1 family aminopeptidase [Aquimarina intermedia]|uniref:ABC-2 family transporter n=1 Tax=Aquimarina intermedia TaxID=350814 RepID=A0A5S5CDZ5_9FLAO|nr:M1 family aminopeptidase [Aquimarina intermedia]TYP76233.1 ABC-2 family transporter [Aquimarina intermedia]
MKEILNFELQYRLGRPATWIYFSLGALIAALLAAFEQSATAEFVNSPNNITGVLVPVSVIAIFFYAAIMGVPVYRDAEHKTAETYFTFPIKPTSYIWGRFLGSYLIASLVNVGIVFGAVIGFGIGAFLERPDFGSYTAFHFSSYVLPFIFILQINALLIGSLFFSLMAFFKKMPIIYLGGIVLFLLYSISGELLSNLDNQWLSIYLDPFGGRAFSLVKKYWSINELNTNSLPIYGKFLINRMLWLSAGIVLFLITLFRFNYQTFLKSAKQKKQKLSSAIVPKAVTNISQYFNKKSERQNLLSLSKIETLSILKDPVFLILLIIGIIVALFTVYKGNETYGTPNLPLTRYVVMYISGGLSLLSIIILVIYSGEAVHRTRKNKTFVFYDALPISDGSLYFSKIIALLSTAVLLTTINIVIAVLYQTINGYFTYELGMQFVYNFVLIFPGFVMTVLLAFFIHVLVNNKFLGHFVVIALYIGLPLLVTLAFKSTNPMLIFTGATPFFISDLNGFGHYLVGVSWLNLYWVLATTILMIVGKLFWTRGFHASFKERMVLAKKRFTAPTIMMFSVTLLLFVAVAGYSYYNLKVLNTINSSTYGDKTGADAEKKYTKYIGQAHPIVTDLKAYIDIYPEERGVMARGEYTITNTDQTKVIDTLLLEMQYPNMHTKLKKVLYNGKELLPVYSDSVYRLFLYKLPEALLPSATAKLILEVSAETKGFANEMETQVLHNGSFLNNQIFPRFHYDRSLVDNGVRRKHGLEKLDYLLPPRSDSAAIKKNLFNEDADYINFEAIVSTAADQIAIAPGKLHRQWTEKDRAYYHYKLESETDLFFNVVSASYDIERAEWIAPSGKKVAIEIYHSPKHKKNLKHFIEGAKVALQYCSENFMEYPNSVLRIVEFPAHSVFAQSFATTIPYSEDFGFAADFDRAEDFNYAFRVTTHEVAHQWWGHLVTPSKTSGANIISETLAEYTSLMTMKQKYGENGIKNFLKYSLDDYLRSRSFSFKPERTLLNVETGQHIWYRKGSMIMYHLQDVIGEKRMNDALKKFTDEFKYYRKGVYPTSQDLYTAIRTITPDSLKYLVDDGFNEIVLYENRVTSAKTEKLPNAFYETTFTVDSKKIYYNDSGKEKYVDSTANYIEIGLFGEDIKDTLDVTLKNPYYLERKWLQPGENTFVVKTKEKPLRAGIDPYNKLIDRDSEDNLQSIEE